MVNEENRRACCLLRVILQGPELLSKMILVEVKMCVKVFTVADFLFKCSAGVDCVFFARKLFKYETRQHNSGFFF